MTTQTEVSFDIPASDKIHVATILKRAKKLGFRFNKLSAQMDLHATHANGNPLDFARFAAADDFNLSHDFIGIANCIDRSNGKLTRNFVPRFSLRDQIAA